MCPRTNVGKGYCAIFFSLFRILNKNYFSYFRVSDKSFPSSKKVRGFKNKKVLFNLKNPIPEEDKLNYILL